MTPGLLRNNNSTFWPSDYNLNQRAGTNPILFTRASRYFGLDGFGKLIETSSGSSAYPGMRAVTNLCTNSNPSYTAGGSTPPTVTNGVVYLGKVCTKIDFPSGSGGYSISRANSSYIWTGILGRSYRHSLSIVMGRALTSGEAMVSYHTGANGLFQIFETFTNHSTSWRRRSYPTADICVVSGPNFSSICISNLNAPLTVYVCEIQVQDVTGIDDGVPSEYVATTSESVTQFFPYANPMSLNSYTATDSGVRTMLAGNNGFISEPSATNLCTCYSTPGADQLGTELVTNGTFSSDTGWTHNSGWTLGGTVAAVNVATNTPLYQGLATTIGKVYRITYTISGYSSGSAIPFIGGTQTGTTRSGNGTYTEDIVSNTASSTCGITTPVSTTSVFSIDDFSIKEVGGTNSVTGAFVSGLGTGCKAVTGNLVIPGINVISGDAAAFLTIVADLTAVTTMGDNSIMPSGKVYKFDNSAGSTVAYFDLTGVINTTNAGIVSLVARASAGSGYFKTDYDGGNTAISSSAYSRLSRVPSLTNTQSRVRMVANANSVIYFYMPQFEDLAMTVPTSYIPTNGATASRSATKYYTPTLRNLAYAGYRVIDLNWTPLAVVVGTEVCLWSSYTDASNYIKISNNGVITFFEKRVAGVSEFVTIDHVPVSGTTALVTGIIYPNNTLGLFVNGVSANAGLGSELITVAADRDFSSDTGYWTKSTGTTITAGVCRLTSVATSLSAISKTTLKTVNLCYQSSAIISGYVAGSIYMCNGTYPFSANGTYTRSNITTVSTENYSTSGTTTLDIDDVSLKQIFNNSTTTPVVLGSTIEIGSFNAGNVTYGQFKNIRMTSDTFGRNNWPLGYSGVSSTGAPTPVYTRNSLYFGLDENSKMGVTSSNSPSYDGMRSVTNKCTSFEGLNWTAAGSTPPTVDSNSISYLGKNSVKVTFPTNSGGWAISRISLPTPIATAIVGRTYRLTKSLVFSRNLTGSESLDIFCSSSGGGAAFILGSVTSSTDITTWKRVSPAIVSAFPFAGNVSFGVSVGGALLSPITIYMSEEQWEDVTGITNQNPSEYVTFNTTQYFPYQNPMSVDGNGVVTDSGVRTMLTAGKGQVSESSGINVCTCYSTPGADQLGTLINSGSTVVGKVYKIASRTSVDFTLAGAANNNVGTQYTCTLAQTMTANDTVNEVGGTNSITGAFVSGLGTGAKSNNVTGLVVPGFVLFSNNVTLTVVDDTAALASSPLSGFSGTKCYEATSVGGDGGVLIPGVFATGVGSISIYARAVSGPSTSGLTLSNGAGSKIITSSSYARISSENLTTTAGQTSELWVTSGSTIRFCCPQTEQSATSTSIMPTNGATGSRSATKSVLTTAAVMPTSGNRVISVKVTPKFVNSTVMQNWFGSYSDSNNYVCGWYNNQGVYVQKTVAGVNEFACWYGTLVVGTTYTFTAVILPDNTVMVMVDSVGGLTGIGSNVAVDPGFDSDPSWLKDDGTWVVGSSVGTGTLSSTSLYQTNGSITTGKVYQLDIDVLTRTAGTLLLTIGGTSCISASSTTGHKTGSNIAAINQNMNVIGAGFSGTVDNFTCCLVNNNTTTLAPVFGTTIEIGSMNSTNVANANIKLLEIG